MTAGRLAELALTARNAVRLAAGARLKDGQELASLPAETTACLRDAVARGAVPPEWTLRNRLTGVSDVAVLELVDGRDLAGVLKLARTSAGNESLRQQQETLHHLRDDARLGASRRILPEVLADGVIGDHRYAIERALPGAVASSTPPTAADQHAVQTIADLHRATGAAVQPSREAIDAWLEPALTLIGGLPTLLGPACRGRLIDGIRTRIRAGIEGRTVWLSRTHGDYFPGNLFLGPTMEVTGIIDWAQSRTDDPAVLDVMTYLLVVRAERSGSGLGSVVRDLCRGTSLTDAEKTLVELHRTTCPADPIVPGVMALLAWVRHVENNLLKSPRYAADPAWVFLTVERVLTVAAR